MDAVNQCCHPTLVAVAALANSQSPLTNRKPVTRAKDFISLWLDHASPESLRRKWHNLEMGGVGTCAGHGAGKSWTLASKREPCSPALGPALQTWVPQQWLSRTLCVPLKGVGELGDQFDFSFKTWIS